MSNINWNNFRAGDEAINCRTEEDSIQFLTECAERGIVWRSGAHIKPSRACYSEFGPRLCFDLRDGRLGYEQLRFYEERQYKIIIYKKPEITGTKETSESNSLLRDFVLGKIALKCNTKEGVAKLLTTCVEMGIYWRNGDKINPTKDCYNECRTGLCFQIHNGRLSYGEVDYYEKYKYNIVDYKIPIVKEKSETKFTWDIFKSGELAVNFITKEDTIQFLTDCISQGICWGPDTPINIVEDGMLYNKYGTMFCFAIIKGYLKYGDYEYYKKNNYIIITYKNQITKESRLTKSEWEDFRNRKFAINCITKEEAQSFINDCVKEGILWYSDRYTGPSGELLYEEYGSATCYFVRNGYLKYGDIKCGTTNTIDNKVISYGKYMVPTEETPTQDNLTQTEILQAESEIRLQIENLQLENQQLENHILLDTSTGNTFYTGKMYMRQGIKIPYCTAIKEEAKVYKTEKIANEVANRLFEKGFTTFTALRLQEPKTLSQLKFSKEDIFNIATKLEVSIEEAENILDFHVEATPMDMALWIYKTHTTTELLNILQNTTTEQSGSLLDNLILSYRNIVKISIGYILIFESK